MDKLNNVKKANTCTMTVKLNGIDPKLSDSSINLLNIDVTNGTIDSLIVIGSSIMNCVINVRKFEGFMVQLLIVQTEINNTRFI